jgi:hypothetical protein
LRSNRWACRRLQDQPRLAAVLDRVEDRHDGGVVDPGGDPRLAQRPVARLRDLPGGQTAELHALQGHVAVEQLVGGPPDRAHAAAA